MSIEYIQREALRREQQVRPGGRILNPHSHSVGLPGEYAFEQWSGIKMNLKRMDHGDGGCDFRYPTIIGIMDLDVKCATHFPPWLMVPQGEISPWTIYVLARLVAKDYASLVGWAWGWDLMKANDLGDHARTGITNYRLLPDQLYPLSELEAIRVR